MADTQRPGWLVESPDQEIAAAGARAPWSRGHAFALHAEASWRAEVDGGGHAAFANLGDKRLSIEVMTHGRSNWQLQPGCVGVWPSRPGIWPIRVSAGRLGLALVDPRISADIPDVPCPLALRRCSGVVDVQLDRLVRLLVAEAGLDAPTASVADNIYVALALHLHRHYAGTDPTVGAEGLSTEHMAAIDAFVEANLDRTIGVSDLARVAGLSRSHLTRMFKAARGVTPYRHIMNCRVQKARELLAETELSIADIASRLGFSDQSHLARVFRKSTASTPLQYRSSTDRRGE